MEHSSWFSDSRWKFRFRKTMHATIHIGLLYFNEQLHICDCKNYIVPAACYRSLSRARFRIKITYLTVFVFLHSIIQVEIYWKTFHSFSIFFISFISIDGLVWRNAQIKESMNIMYKKLIFLYSCYLSFCEGKCQDIAYKRHFIKYFIYIPLFSCFFCHHNSQYINT